MSYQVQIFNTGHYASYQAAKDCGAVYSTGSTIDATETRSGIYDTQEIVEAVCKCLNDGDLLAGVVEGGVFVSLDSIIEEMEKDEESEITTLVARLVQRHKEAFDPIWCIVTDGGEIEEENLTQKEAEQALTKALNCGGDCYLALMSDIKGSSNE